MVRWLSYRQWKIHPMGVCKEYAPAKDFYVIYKEYYLNGMIKERGKFMPVAFGKWKIYLGCTNLAIESEHFLS